MCRVHEEGPGPQLRRRRGDRHRRCKLVCVCGGILCQRSMKATKWLLQTQPLHRGSRVQTGLRQMWLSKQLGRGGLSGRGQARPAARVWEPKAHGALGEAARGLRGLKPDLKPRVAPSEDSSGIGGSAGRDVVSCSAHEPWTACTGSGVSYSVPLYSSARSYLSHTMRLAFWLKNRGY